MVLGFYRREVTMPSAEEQIAKILQDQPDDSSHEEILLDLAFSRMVENGQVIPTREGRSLTKKWDVVSRHGGTDTDC